jgi:hypothetical protein
MAACSIVSSASSETGCTLKWRIARWLWMASKSDMCSCVMVEPLTSTFSLTKSRHQEERILRVTGFYTSEKTAPRQKCHALNNTNVVKLVRQM